MAVMKPEICDFGWKAVDAKLYDGEGRPFQLFELMGENGLVIAFICNHCPFVKSIAAKLQRDAHDLASQGVSFVAISSNDVDNYPEDSPANMVAFAKQSGFTFPYLYDEDQSVAKAYGAVCTPDFFGFNNKFELQYRGRLDATTSTKISDELERDLYNAMTEVAETGKGPKDQIQSMGCSIKWK